MNQSQSEVKVYDPDSLPSAKKSKAVMRKLFALTKKEIRLTPHEQNNLEAYRWKKLIQDALNDEYYKDNGKTVYDTFCNILSKSIAVALGAPNRSRFKNKYGGDLPVPYSDHEMREGILYQREGKDLKGNREQRLWKFFDTTKYGDLIFTNNGGESINEYTWRTFLTLSVAGMSAQRENLIESYILHYAEPERMTMQNYNAPTEIACYVFFKNIFENAPKEFLQFFFYYNGGLRDPQMVMFRKIMSDIRPYLSGLVFQKIYYDINDHLQRLKKALTAQNILEYLRQQRTWQYEIMLKDGMWRYYSQYRNNRYAGKNFMAAIEELANTEDEYITLMRNINIENYLEPDEIAHLANNFITSDPASVLVPEDWKANLDIALALHTDLLKRIKTNLTSETLSAGVGGETAKQKLMAAIRNKLEQHHCKRGQTVPLNTKKKIHDELLNEGLGDLKDNKLRSYFSQLGYSQERTKQ